MNRTTDFNSWGLKMFLYGRSMRWKYFKKFYSNFKNHLASLIPVINHWAISWLTRQILKENTRQNWLGQEPTAVITVSNYWAISWLTRRILVENTRQNSLRQEPTSVIIVSNQWAISCISRQIMVVELLAPEHEGMNKF